VHQQRLTGERMQNFRQRGAHALAQPCRKDNDIQFRHVIEKKNGEEQKGTSPNIFFTIRATAASNLSHRPSKIQMHPSSGGQLAIPRSHV
jgi:hypothetical protein